MIACSVFDLTFWLAFDSSMIKQKVVSSVLFVFYTVLL